jgi:hypothetical protein
MGSRRGLTVAKVQIAVPAGFDFVQNRDARRFIGIHQIGAGRIAVSQVLDHGPGQEPNFSLHRKRQAATGSTHG